MTKTILFATILAAVLITGALSATTVFADDDDNAKKVKKGKQKVSVTVTYNDVTLEPGEAIVLLDTTGSGTLYRLHIAANLPCDSSSGPTAGGGNDTPDLLIVAGVAGGAVAPVIGDATDDTGFIGPNGTCIFHDTSDKLPFDGVNSVTLDPETVTSITDVILINLGGSPVTLPVGTTITVTGTYAK